MRRIVFTISYPNVSKNYIVNHDQKFIVAKENWTKNYYFYKYLYFVCV